MKEFDFDELDKAVNSVVAQNDLMPAPSVEETVDASNNNYVRPISTAPWTPPVVTPDPAVETPDLVPAITETMVKQIEPVVVPAVEIPASFAPRATTVIGGPKPVISAGRRGGFMDIVTPKPTQPTRFPSRTAAPVQPVDSVVMQPSAASDDLVSAFVPQLEEKPIAVEPAAAWSAESAPASTAEPSVASPVWPDPINLDNPESTQLAPEVSAPVEVTAGQDDFGFRSESTSPFLPDTKVEKRPLGAYSDNAPAEQTPIAPTSFFTPLGSPVAAAETAVSTAPAAVPPADAYGTSSYAATPAVLSPQVLAIPDQEKAAPVQPGGLIFDTKEYHPPLLEATAHSGHSGVGVKMAIGLLLVIFVAAVGYIVYKLVSL